jgi:phosphate acetyltransferase
MKPVSKPEAHEKYQRLIDTAKAAGPVLTAVAHPAATKQIISPVAGRANVLVVPDLEAGNMLAKALSFLAGADSAGIVLGARVPIILTSRADSLTARLASCAFAALIAKFRRDQAAVRPQ